MEVHAGVCPRRREDRQLLSRLRRRRHRAATNTTPDHDGYKRGEKKQKESALLETTRENGTPPASRHVLGNAGGAGPPFEVHHVAGAGLPDVLFAIVRADAPTAVHA